MIDVPKNDAVFNVGIQLLERLAQIHPKVIDFISSNEDFRTFEVDRHPGFPEVCKTEVDNLTIILEILGFEVTRLGDAKFEVIRND